MENFTFLNPPRIRCGRGPTDAPAVAATLRARGMRRIGARADITPAAVEKILCRAA